MQWFMMEMMPKPPRVHVPSTLVWWLMVEISVNAAIEAAERQSSTVPARMSMYSPLAPPLFI
jgi:hypothetical protein